MVKILPELGGAYVSVHCHISRSLMFGMFREENSHVLRNEGLTAR